MSIGEQEETVKALFHHMPRSLGKHRRRVGHHTPDLKFVGGETLDRFRCFERSSGLLRKIRGIALAACYCSALPTLSAAPVTFNFEATVASVFPVTAASELPFEIVHGDSITATLEFEPRSGGPIYPQSASVCFQAGGQVLEADALEVRIENNAGAGVDLRGRIADPNATPDIDLTGTSDNIFMSCSPTAFCGVAPEHSNYSFRPLLAFSHDETLLNSDDLIADVGTWNTFSFREMSLIFRDANTGGETYIGAYLGGLRQVPEPPAVVLFIGAGLLGSWLMRSRILKPDSCSRMGRCK